jgi:hypothetical protein
LVGPFSILLQRVKIVDTSPMHRHGNGLHKANFRLCLQQVKMPDADLQVLAHQLHMVKTKEFERFERKNSGEHGLYRHVSGDSTHTDKKEKGSWQPTSQNKCKC